jgi:hypothetical protein
MNGSAGPGQRGDWGAAHLQAGLDAPPLQPTLGRLPAADLELTGVVCGQVLSHPKNLMQGLAEHLARTGVEGRVALVGDDLLPGMYDRKLRRATPQIEWCSDETLLLEPQRIKSQAELEVFRRAGALVTEALTALVEALRAGSSSAEGAARAAAALVRGGGGYHRIDVHHGRPRSAPSSVRTSTATTRGAGDGRPGAGLDLRSDP